MRLASFLYDGIPAYGAVQGDEIIAAGAEVMRRYPDLSKLIAADAAGELQAGLDREKSLPVRDATFLPPIGDTGKCACIGVNYRAHIAETGREQPQHPSTFLKSTDALVGSGQPIERPRISDKFDYEGELALVIGKGGRHIHRDDVFSHIYGYSCFNDGSVRDFQRHSVTAGKNFPNSSSLGPWIVTADEIPDPRALTLTTRVNGTEVQRSGTDMLIFDIPAIVAYVSSFTTLRPGDVIATGTPSGVGSRRDPPLWLKPGDVLEVEITGIGTLRNPVIAEA